MDAVLSSCSANEPSYVEELDRGALSSENIEYYEMEKPSVGSGYEFAREMKLGLMKRCCHSPLFHLIVDLLSSKKSRNIIEWSSSNPSVFHINDREGLVQMWSEQSKMHKSYISVVCQLKTICNTRVPIVFGDSTRILSRISTGDYRIFPDYAAHEVPLISPKFLEWQLKKEMRRKKRAENTNKREMEKSRISPVQRRSAVSPCPDGPHYKAQTQVNLHNHGLLYYNDGPTMTASAAVASDGAMIPELSVDDVDAVLIELERPCKPFDFHQTSPLQFGQTIDSTARCPGLTEGCSTWANKNFYISDYLRY